MCLVIIYTPFVFLATLVMRLVGWSVTMVQTEIQQLLDESPLNVGWHGMNPHGFAVTLSLHFALELADPI